MKKLLLVAVITVFGLTNINAQDIEFGVKAGVNFATITGDDTDVDSRTSFHIGGVAEISISEKFSLQLELLYSAQGYKFEESDGTFTFKETTKLDYLNVPIMIKYYVAEGFSIEVGPQVGFLLSAKSEFEEDGDSQEEDIKDFVKGIDFGINLGVGYKMDTGLNFGARYNLGLSNILDDSDDFKIQNAVIQVSVGYMF